MSLLTNTSDFRRYSYSGDAALAIEAFSRTRSSAAPKYTPERKKELKVRENTKLKSKTQLKAEQKLNTSAVLAIVICSAVVLLMLFGAISSMAQKNELTHEIARYERQLSVAQSENTRITSELDALVSMSSIDKYAVEELGMTKMQPNQIRYINVTEFEEEYHAVGVDALESVQE